MTNEFLSEQRIPFREFPELTQNFGLKVEAMPEHLEVVLLVQGSEGNTVYRRAIR